MQSVELNQHFLFCTHRNKCRLCAPIAQRLPVKRYQRLEDIKSFRARAAEAERERQIAMEKALAAKERAIAAEKALAAAQEKVAKIAAAADR